VSEEIETFKRVTYGEAMAGALGAGVGLVSGELALKKMTEPDSQETEKLNHLYRDEYQLTKVRALQTGHRRITAEKDLSTIRQDIKVLENKVFDTASPEEYVAWGGGAALIGAVALAGLVYAVRKRVFRGRKAAQKEDQHEAIVERFSSELRDDHLFHTIVEQWRRKKGKD
jgi:hypothetical protein